MFKLIKLRRSILRKNKKKLVYNLRNNIFSILIYKKLISFQNLKIQLSYFNSNYKFNKIKKSKHSTLILTILLIDSFYFSFYNQTKKKIFIISCIRH
jgi:hypothetical protein